MQVLFKIIKRAFLLIFILFIGWMFLYNWSFVFKKRVVGEVSTIENVNNGIAVIANNARPLNPQVFSYSVAIKDLDSGEIHMASSEDRKWGAVQPGNCVVAAFFPYAPWKLSKGNTDFNARLLHNYQNCDQVTKNDNLDFWGKFKFFFMWD